MSKIRKFLAIPVYGPCGGCYHGGFNEIFDEGEKEMALADEIKDGDDVGIDLAVKPASKEEWDAARTQPLPFGHTAKQLDQKSGDKYKRVIWSVDGKNNIVVDVYCVLDAFKTGNPAIDHALKKLLCAGIRGKGDVVQDLTESVDAINRAITIQATRGTQ